MAGLVQVLIQALTFGAGLLTVNALTRRDFAFYSLALAVSSGISTVAHSGLTSVVMTAGGRLAEGSVEFQQLLRCVVQKRARTTLASGALGILILMVLLWRNGASSVSSLFLAVVVLALAWLNGAGAILADVLALRLRFADLQWVSVAGSLLRLLLTSLWAIGSLGGAVVALGISCICGLSTNVAMRHRAGPSLSLSDSDVQAWRGVVSASVRTKLPANVFMVLQGQFVVLLLSALALTGTVADISAVSRFCAVFAVFGATARWVVAPWVARATFPRALRGYARVAVGMILVICAISGGSWILSGHLLGLLGGQYLHLDHALVIVVFGAGIGSLADVLSAMNDARGWIRWSWVQIPLSVIVLGTTAALGNLSSPTGAAMFAGAGGLAWLLAQSFQVLVGSLTERRAALAPAERFDKSPPKLVDR